MIWSSGRLDVVKLISIAGMIGGLLLILVGIGVI
jgi:hypothetical protein